MLRVLLPLFLGVCITGVSPCQETPRSLLWKVTPPGAEKPSYLYGTIHSRDSRAFGLSDSVWIAMGRAEVVAGELDLEKSKQNPLALMNAMMLPEGKRLEEFYKKKDWQLIDEHLKERLGMMAAMVQRMKPFFVMAMLTETEMSADEERVLDDHILSTAREQGQRVIGIETVEEQMLAMDALPVEQQADMLLEYVKNGAISADLNAMMDAYEEQDLDALMQIIMSDNYMPETLERALLVDRNVRMVHRLDSIMQGGENVFFAVGAAHLPTDDGLIALLRKQGYAVEPVMSKIVRRQEMEPAIEEKE
jgi:uncharacterized protein